MLQQESISRKSVTARYNGLVQACYVITKEEGFKAFWKGHLTAQYLSVVYGGIQFGVYNWSLKSLYGGEKSPSANFLSGCIAGGVAMLVAHPLDVVRTRLVAQGEPRTYQTFSEAVKCMALHEGPISFYRGIIANIIQVAPYSGLVFGCYYFIHPYLEVIPYFPASMMSGAIAGVLGKTVVYPFDLIKKRLQVQGFTDRTHNFGRYDGIISCIRSISRKEGINGFYKGYVPSTLKSMAVSACQFSFFEVAMVFIEWQKRQWRSES